MLRLVWRLAGSVRRRPILSLAVALVVLAVAATVGLHYWALSHYQAAAQALDDDCPGQARNHIAVCLTVWPYSSATRLLAARIARAAGDYPEAETRLQECKRLREEAPLEVHLEALLLRAEQGEVDALEKDLVAALNRDEPHARLILESLGRSKMNLMNYRPALYYLDLCLERYPDDIRALDLRGLTRERLANRDKAVPDYQRAIELSHGRADGRLRLATLYLDAAEPTAAEPHLQSLAKTQPDRPEVQLGWARCKFLQGQVEEARKLLDAFLAAHPDDYTALTLRGELALGDDKPEEAEGFFRRALKQDRSNPAVYNSLYDSLRAQPGRQGEADAALQEYDRVRADSQRLHQLLARDLENSGEGADALAEVGELCLRLDRDQMGLHWLLAALKRDPNLKRVHKALAAYYDEKGEAEAAKEHRRLAE